MASILLVEDFDDVAVIFESILVEEGGHTVDRAATAEDAVDRVIGGSYDLILMDITLPDTSGTVAALALRGLGFEGPIIITTGGAKPISDDLYDRAGFAGKLLKPVRRQELLDEVELQLAKASADPAAP